MQSHLLLAYETSAAVITLVRLLFRVGVAVLLVVALVAEGLVAEFASKRIFGTHAVRCCKMALQPGLPPIHFFTDRTLESLFGVLLHVDIQIAFARECFGTVGAHEVEGGLVATGISTLAAALEVIFQVTFFHKNFSALVTRGGHVL